MAHVVFKKSDTELIQKWQEEHKDSCTARKLRRPDGSIRYVDCGGLGEWLSFTLVPCALGWVCEVNCPCGEKLELPDE